MAFDVLKAESCVSDTELSPLEDQIFAQLRLLQDDRHPDAHACRLKVSLATLASRDRMPVEWSVEEELTDYVLKHDRVSATCRLTMLEEAELLDEVYHNAQGLNSGDVDDAGQKKIQGGRFWSSIDNVVLYNRRNFIKAALEGSGRPVRRCVSIWRS